MLTAIQKRSVYQRQASFIARAERCRLWFKQAMEEGRAGGLSAISAAERAFAAGVSPRYRHNEFKLRVEGVIRLGAVAARQHYGDIARFLPSDIDAAIGQLGRDRDAEQLHQATLMAHGMTDSARASQTRIDRLRIALVVLRLVRRHGGQFIALREDVAKVDPLIAALRNARRQAGWR